MQINRVKIVTGLDIGSSKVSAVAASIGKDGGFSIIAQVTQDSRGVSRGAITDLDEAVRSVSGALKKLKEKAPNGLGHIYANITGETLKGSVSKGMIPLSLRGREVTKFDMARCINAASTVHLPFDREIVHKVVQKFSIDDQPWIRDPMGLYASRLACEVFIITAAVNSIQNISKCVSSAGYDVREVVYTGIADGSAVLDNEEKESGVILIGMGAELTEISTFFKGVICDMEILQAGAEDLKNDFRSSPAFDNVIAKVAQKLASFKDSGRNIRSIVVTGGIIFADGVIEYLEEKLSCQAKMGVAKDVRGEVSGLDSMRLSTAIGLAKYAASKQENLPQNAKNFAKTVSSAVIDIFNNYF
ncbi:MAG: cell division protein FtsA [Candidatus Omnitrophica bacterium]|nr:cell division protein FtsA [Candidatus Omnitrophota bacterium]